MITEILDVVRFCAIECEIQLSGARSVSDMVNAWCHADQVGLPISIEYVEDLGRIIDPRLNAEGLRSCGVRVGSDIKPDWQSVPRLLEVLVAAQDTLAPAEWFHEFEEIHPFRDGNGRTGQILYNLLNGTLNAPVWAPNFYNDRRRTPNEGAP